MSDAVKVITAERFDVIVNMYFFHFLGFWYELRDTIILKLFVRLPSTLPRTVS